MEIREIQAFCSAARLGSISRAAEALDVGQPTLSKRIKAFERELGGPLFLRTKRPLRLTRLGTRLYDAVVPLTRILDDIDSMVSGEELERPVSVAASYPISDHIVPEVVREFARAHPRVRLRIRVGGSAEVIEQLARGEVEFGLVHVPAVTSDMKITELGSYDRVLVTLAGHPILREADISLESIARWPLILGRVGSYSRTSLENHFRNLGVQFETAIEVDNNWTMKKYAAIGLGITIVPRIALEPRDYEDTGVVSLRGVLPIENVCLVHMDGAVLSQSSVEFIDRVQRVAQRIQAQIGTSRPSAIMGHISGLR